MKPICKNCGDSGKGAQFSLSSGHGFGTFCVKCEELVDAKALKVIAKLQPIADAVRSTFDPETVSSMEEDLGGAVDEQRVVNRNGGRSDKEAAHKALDKWYRGGE